MSAIINASAKITKSVTPAEPKSQVTAKTAADPDALSRKVMELARSLAQLQAQSPRQSIEFEDLAFDATGTKVFSFRHNFGARVRWFVVDVSGATAAPVLMKHASTDANTLALVSYVACTATIRVEKAS